MTIDVNELPARFAEVVSIAERGDEVLITSAGQPSARFVPLPQMATKPRILGLNLGAAVVPRRFQRPPSGRILDG